MATLGDGTLAIFSRNAGKFLCVNDLFVIFLYYSMWRVLSLQSKEATKNTCNNTMVLYIKESKESTLPFIFLAQQGAGKGRVRLLWVLRMLFPSYGIM